MSISRFRVVIMKEDGTFAVLHPGGKGERDMTQAITEQVIEKGVGFFKTEAQVKLAVEEAISEVLHELKSEVEPL